MVLQVRATKGRLLGLVPAQSQIISFADDRGTSLDKDAQPAEAGPVYVESDGSRMTVSLRAARTPSRDAQRVVVRARLTLEISDGTETTATATLAPAEDRVLETTAGDVHVTRTDGVAPLSPWDDPSPPAPATVITLKDVEGVDRLLGEARFHVDGKELSGAKTSSTRMVNGHVSRERGYILARTKRPVVLDLPVVTPSHEQIELEVVGGLTFD